MTVVQESVADLIITALKSVEADGETMQYIIEKTGMQDQMLRQLIMSASIDEVQELIEEKTKLTKD